MAYPMTRKYIDKCIATLPCPGSWQKLHADRVPKYLFLDIDGVLNNMRWCVSNARREMRRLDLGKKTPRNKRTYELDPQNVKNLKALLQACPDLRVVVSSTWRLGMTVYQLRTMFAVYGIPRAKIIDKTGRDESRLRYKEITTWLDSQAKIDECQAHYIALDDDTHDMHQLGKNFFHVPNKAGLTRKIVRQAVKFLHGCGCCRAPETRDAGYRDNEGL